MKNQTKIILWSIIGLTFYGINLITPSDSKDEVKTSSLVDAIVECEYDMKAKLNRPNNFKVDSPFKYKGTKEITKGSKYQVAGQVSYDNVVNKPYGCIVHFSGGTYTTEVVL